MKKPTAEKLRARVINTLAEQIGCSEEEVKPEMLIEEELGTDSLDMVEITMSLEEEFNIEISDEKFETVTTVQSLINLMNDLVKPES
jgi:acyl carrier protein